MKPSLRTFDAAPIPRANAVDEAGSEGEVTGRTPYADVLLRLEEAEDTLRAIGVGEIDAFVVSDGESERRVFTLSTADRPYRRFVENMRDGAATLSATGVILYANRRLAELLSSSREEILGTRLNAFLDAHATIEWETLRGAGPGGTTVELTLLNVHGDPIPVLVGVSPLGEDDDHLTCLTFTDLSFQKAQDQEIARLSEAQAARLADLQDAQAALTKQATHDSLTGLPNRDLLVDRIDQALLQAVRAHHCVAVFFIDLDRFKHVNDTRGHAVGNRVLQNVAERLQIAVRGMDTVARIGGDEFVVLAPAVASRLDAAEMGLRLAEVLNGGTVEVGASIGMSVSDGDRSSAEIMLHEADTAMYQAKAKGGGRSQLFDGELARQARARLSAQTMLREALDERRVVPHYQPIVDLANGTVAGFEALARLVQRDGTVLSPAAFIDVAEETGLVLPLGAEMLVRSCEQAVLWHAGLADESGPAVSVNVSSRQLELGDLPGTIRRVLTATGLTPARLHLELTETAIMDLHPEILRQLSRIRDLGVQIGLDDFGTGYASLTHLRRLPLNFVKVDRSFVNGLGADAGDDRIVSAVIDLGRNLGLRSIGEGVETMEQLDRLRELGCDQAQGYLFSRPMPPEEISLVSYRLPGTEEGSAPPTSATAGGRT